MERLFDVRGNLLIRAAKKAGALGEELHYIRWKGLSPGHMLLGL